MIFSLSLIFLVGLSMAFICEKIKLPRIIGMLVTGLCLSPYVLDLFDPKILGISSELRQIALIIIMIKAGLSLNLEDLKKCGRPALLLSFVPACFEIAAYIIFAPLLLNLSFVEAALMGAVLSAVSPAVVVPRMVYYIEHKVGTNKQIPQMLLAGASLDDVFVIVLFTSFLAMATGDGINVLSFLNIPISIVLGVALGVASGLVLALFFRLARRFKINIRDVVKVIILLASSFMLMSIQNFVESFVSISGLLAIISMALTVHMAEGKEITKILSDKYGKMWIIAECILFVLVGAAVDIRYTLSAGAIAIILILLALLVRAIGVFICLLGTKLNMKERLFCIFVYLPKATVQAAIGSVPLSMGLPCGNIILSVSVLAILITAPLGAILMDTTNKFLLTKEIDSTTD